MFSIFTHVLEPVRDTNSEPGSPVLEGEMLLQRRDDNVVVTFLRIPEDVQSNSDEYWNISAKACQEDAQ